MAFASFGAGFGEVEIFDDYGVCAVPFSSGDDAGDDGSQVPVAGRGGQPGQVEADGRRGAQDVTVGRYGGDGQVPSVDVEGHYGVPLQFLQGRRRCPGGRP
jgi:hypothetical protein